MSFVMTLALATFVLVLGFLLWNRASVRRNQKTGGTAGGLGGSADPLSGAGADVRNPATMRASLDQAAARPLDNGPIPRA